MKFSRLHADVLAGLTTSFALLPECIAFALVAHLNPLMGLYGAFIICTITALFGGRPGMVFWHPNGWTLYQVLEQYMRKVQRDNGYLEIKTPQVVDRSLWEKSGHWANYAENMFTTESENRDYAIKPMNCPCHVQVFNQGLKSYRELPLRLAEFGACHRNEPSGALHGIMRVRAFTQDDAHIFCTEEQDRRAHV